MQTIIITIETAKGTVERRYGYYDDSAELDWNPIVNDMVDSIEKVAIETNTSRGVYKKGVKDVLSEVIKGTEELKTLLRDR